MCRNLFFLSMAKSTNCGTLYLLITSALDIHAYDYLHFDNDELSVQNEMLIIGSINYMHVLDYNI